MKKIWVSGGSRPQGGVRVGVGGGVSFEVGWGTSAVIWGRKCRLAYLLRMINFRKENIWTPSILKLISLKVPCPRTLWKVLMFPKRDSYIHSV